MELLEDRKQVILQGPRGTGKTHMARNLAKLPSGDEGRVTRSEAFGRPWGHFSNAQVCRGHRAATGYNLYNLHFYCSPKEALLMNADVESTGMGQADTSPEDLRLLEVLQQLVEDRGPTRAATALG